MLECNSGGILDSSIQRFSLRELSSVVVRPLDEMDMPVNVPVDNPEADTEWCVPLLGEQEMRS